MRIKVNGEEKEVNPSENIFSLEELIDQLEFHPQLIVVELNGLIINPKEWKKQQIQGGDILEIVTIVGGC